MQNREIVIIRAQAAAEQEAVVARCESLTAAALEKPVQMLIRERDRAAVAELVLADQGAQLHEDQAMVSDVRDTALGMQAQFDEFVAQYSTKRVIDQECSEVKEHE